MWTWRFRLFVVVAVTTLTVGGSGALATTAAASCVATSDDAGGSCTIVAAAPVASVFGILGNATDVLAETHVAWRILGPGIDRTSSYNGNTGSVEYAALGFAVTEGEEYTLSITQGSATLVLVSGQSTRGYTSPGGEVDISNGGDASGSLLAISTTGNAEASNTIPVGPGQGVAVSGTGCATGSYALSASCASGSTATATATGCSDGGRLAVSAVGCANGETLAVSGAGDSSGEIAASGIGCANGVYAIGITCANGDAVTVRGVGDSSGDAAAVSGTGCATAMVAVGGSCANGSVVSVAGTGDASGGVTAISVGGNAYGDIALAGYGDAGYDSCDGSAGFSVLGAGCGNFSNDDVAYAIESLIPGNPAESPPSGDSTLSSSSNECWGRSDNPHRAKKALEASAKSRTYCKLGIEQMLYVESWLRVSSFAGNMYEVDHGSRRVYWTDTTKNSGGDLRLSYSCRGFGYRTWLLTSYHQVRFTDGVLGDAWTSNAQSFNC